MILSLIRRISFLLRMRPFLIGMILFPMWPIISLVVRTALLLVINFDGIRGGHFAGKFQIVCLHH